MPYVINTYILLRSYGHSSYIEKNCPAGRLGGLGGGSVGGVFFEVFGELAEGEFYQAAVGNVSFAPTFEGWLGDSEELG